MVAPHAGAWIETWCLSPESPFREVAPHAGAWIETYNNALYHHYNNVAPHAGAWIETKLLKPKKIIAKSRPMRARGLKLRKGIGSKDRRESRPMRARGLKQYLNY